MLLGTLGASVLGNMLAGIGITRAGYGFKKGKGIIRARYGSKLDWNWLILQLILKYKSIIRMNQDSMEFVLEIIYLKNKGMGYV